MKCLIFVYILVSFEQNLIQGLPQEYNLEKDQTVVGKPQPNDTKALGAPPRSGNDRKPPGPPPPSGNDTKPPGPPPPSGHGAARPPQDPESNKAIDNYKKMFMNIRSLETGLRQQKPSLFSEIRAIKDAKSPKSNPIPPVQHVDDMPTPPPGLPPCELPTNDHYHAPNHIGDLLPAVINITLEGDLELDRKLGLTMDDLMAKRLSLRFVGQLRATADGTYSWSRHPTNIGTIPEHVPNIPNNNHNRLENRNGDRLTSRQFGSVDNIAGKVINGAMAGGLGLITGMDAGGGYHGPPAFGLASQPQPQRPQYPPVVQYPQPQVVAYQQPQVLPYPQQVAYYPSNGAMLGK